VSALTDDHERNAGEIETKYQAKLRALQAQNDLRRKTELHELEERKNKQVHTLMRNHEKAFADIKNYYNDITSNNMALINTLKVIDVTFSLYVHKKLNCRSETARRFILFRNIIMHKSYKIAKLLLCRLHVFVHFLLDV